MNFVGSVVGQNSLCANRGAAPPCCGLAASVPPSTSLVFTSLCTDWDFPDIMCGPPGFPEWLSPSQGPALVPTSQRCAATAPRDMGNAEVRCLLRADGL